MQCSFCGYEYTMREMQADAPCPKCAEQKASACCGMASEPPGM